VAALFAIGLVFVAVAIVLVFHAVTLPRRRMASHLRQIDTYGFHSASEGAQTAAVRPPLGWEANALAESVGRFTMARVPTLTPLSGPVLTSAGFYKLSPEAFHGYRTMASLLLPALLVLEAVAAGTSLPLVILAALIGAAASWAMFGAVVHRRSDARTSEIDRALPELIDVLTATVEAGLGFAGSLQLVAGRFEGPLGSELRLALREQTMGLSTNQALANMVERSDTPAMRSFARAILQGETLGVSIGAMLRNLAVELRTRRRQAAQERAQKTPVKLLFPLIFFVFPALLLVLFYPAAHEVVTTFSGTS
jgi:Flp pilus assembly protein TadB